jgi:hypothetical protein
MPKRRGFSELRRPDWSFKGRMPTFGSTMSRGSLALCVMHHSPSRWPNWNSRAYLGFLVEDTDLAVLGPSGRLGRSTAGCRIAGCHRRRHCVRRHRVPRRRPRLPQRRHTITPRRQSLCTCSAQTLPPRTTADQGKAPGQTQPGAAGSPYHLATPSGNAAPLSSGTAAPIASSNSPPARRSGALFAAHSLAAPQGARRPSASIG